MVTCMSSDLAASLSVSQSNGRKTALLAPIWTQLLGYLPLVYTSFSPTCWEAPRGTHYRIQAAWRVHPAMLTLENDLCRVESTPVQPQSLLRSGIGSRHGSTYRFGRVQPRTQMIRCGVQRHCP